MHRLDLLCLHELGKHEVGLQGRKHMDCNSQEDLLQLIVNMANEDLQGGASEPAVQVGLLSGQYPTHASLPSSSHKNMCSSVPTLKLKVTSLAGSSHAIVCAQ